MNKDRMEGDWRLFAGKARERWGKLTDDDMTVIQGKREQLEGRVQNAYGIARDEARKQVEEFNKALAASSKTPVTKTSNTAS